jgi:hypothetical protein
MPPEGLRRELCIRSHVAACMAAPVFDPQKALNYQRALATSRELSMNRPPSQACCRTIEGPHLVATPAADLEEVLRNANKTVRRTPRRDGRGRGQ